MKVTYEMIKPILINEERLDEYQIKLTFKTENQAKPLTVTAFVPKLNPKGEKKKSFFSNRKKKNMQLSEKMHDEIREDAIVQAFKTLCIFYDYDKENKKWIFKPPY